MSAAVVRDARPADRAAALGLWRALHREHEALDPRYRLADDAPERWAADFGEWVRSDLHALLVAEDEDGALVGLLVAHVGLPAPVYAPVPYVHVDDLYVAPGWRGRGVGRRLVHHVRRWAEAQGAAPIQVGVLTENPSARAFWRAMGAEDFSATVLLSGD